MTPEKKVKDGVKPTLKYLKSWYYMPVSNGMGAHGIPDFVCCVPTVVTQEMVGKTVGLFMGVETKAPGKVANVSEKQKLQLEAIGEAGGLTFVTDNPATFQINCLNTLRRLHVAIPAN